VEVICGICSFASGFTAVMATRKIPLICSGHSRPVPDFSYSRPLEDGFYLISACLDGKAMLRKGETGDWIGTFVGHKGATWSAHLNSSAQQAATGSADYTAKVWNAVSGDELHSFQHSRIVKSVHFSPDDTKLLTGGQDKILRVFDLNRADAEPKQMEGHTQSVKSALWLPGNFIVSGGGENQLRIWDQRTLQPEKVLSLKAPATGIELCLDGKHMAITAGKEVSFFNINTFEIEKSYTVGVEVNSASLSPDGQTFVTGGVDFWARVHEFSTGKELECLKGHHGPIHCIRFAPDGQTFASGGEDGTIRLWQSGEPRAYGLWQEVKP